MSAYWATIIMSRYGAGTITAERVQSYVPKLITQAEADEIISSIGT